MPILEELNIVNDLMNTVKCMRWEKLIFQRLDAYENLVEIHSSLRLKTNERNNILDYDMHFPLHGENYVMTRQ